MRRDEWTAGTDQSQPPPAPHFLPQSVSRSSASARPSLSPRERRAVEDFPVRRFTLRSVEATPFVTAASDGGYGGVGGGYGDRFRGWVCVLASRPCLRRVVRPGIWPVSCCQRPVRLWRRGTQRGPMCCLMAGVSWSFPWKRSSQSSRDVRGRRQRSARMGWTCCGGGGSCPDGGPRGTVQVGWMRGTSPGGWRSHRSRPGSTGAVGPPARRACPARAVCGGRAESGDRAGCARSDVLGGDPGSLQGRAAVVRRLPPGGRHRP
jgi:hypothetical protein